MSEELNLLVTVNDNYIPPLLHMLRSAVRATPERKLHLYLVHSGISRQGIERVEQTARQMDCHMTPIEVDDAFLRDAPVTEQFPREMYYRIFAAQILPQTLERTLYLDPDLVVLHSLAPLYDINMEESFFAAAGHINEYSQKLNNLRLDTPIDNTYINSGVLLLNLRLLRRKQDTAAVFSYIEENRKKLLLPDQDVINALYSERTTLLDPLLYNFDARYFNLLCSLGKVDMQWVLDNTVILHFCGKQKPWKNGYRGGKRLKYIYEQAAVTCPVAPPPVTRRTKQPDISVRIGSARFNYRVGAVITDGRRLLVMQDELTEGVYYYLPGGRVRMGETAEQAILRELCEELGIKAEITRPLWCCQSFFIEPTKQEEYHEICLYFLIDYSKTELLDLGDSFERRDGKHRLSFAWMDYERLQSERIVPEFISERIASLPQGLETVIDR